MSITRDQSVLCIRTAPDGDTNAVSNLACQPSFGDGAASITTALLGAGPTTDSEAAK